MAKLKAPKNASSVTWKGKEYPVEKGHVHVPEEAHEELKAHGFVPADGVAAPQDDERSDNEKLLDQSIPKVTAAIGALGDKLTLEQAQALKNLESTKPNPRPAVVKLLDEAITKLTPAPV